MPKRLIKKPQVDINNTLGGKNMKRFIAVAISILLFTSTFGCTPEKTDESSLTETTSLISSDESSQESIETSIPISDTEDISLPEHVFEDKQGFLRFTDSSGDISAVFPDEFSVLCTEYKPDCGIYLQNHDGTATLQIEAIENDGISREDLVDYLNETYTDSDIYINDAKNIICKTTVTDNSGNKSACYMKAVITDKGYNEAVLYFKAENENKYKSFFNKISIS